MVFVGDKKYACETCIKGHRSSTCKHADRPLYEIKKKGRPVTQCEHCRELRKTKQVHVKCMCAAIPAFSDPSASSVLSSSGTNATVKKGGSKVPASAAFPSGLPPEALGASVALQPLASASDGSDSERSHISPDPCDCDTTASCSCAHVRVARPSKGKSIARPRARRGSSEHAASPHAHSPAEPPIAGPAGIVASAHASGHRPVLPRPPVPPQESTASFRPVHDPSSALQVPSRHSHSHGHGHPQLYSPYGRAYEHVHGGDELDFGLVIDAQPPSLLSPQNQPQPQDPLPLPLASPDSALPDFQTWFASFSSAPIPPPVSPPIPRPASDGGTDVDATVVLGSISLCGCGPSCACLGCIEHRGRAADTSGASGTCVDPGACAACLECAMMNAPVQDVPALSYTDQGSAIAGNVDEWLRQVAAMLPEPPSQQPLSQSSQRGQMSPLAPSGNGTQSPHDSQQPVQQQQDVPYDPALLQTYALWASLRDSNASPDSVSGHNLGFNSSTARPSQVQWEGSMEWEGTPEWDSALDTRPVPTYQPDARSEKECCKGGATGCACPPGMCACANSGGDDGRETGRLTFAVSGERQGCCAPVPSPGAEQRLDAMDVDVGNTLPSVVSWPSNSLTDAGAYSPWNTNATQQTNQAALMVPRVTLSRASSRSSQSSSGASRTSGASSSSASSSLGAALVLPPIVGAGSEPVERGGASTDGRSSCSSR